MFFSICLFGSAAYLTDVPFVLVGPWDNNAVNQLRVIASPNVRFTGGLYGEELVHIYSQAKVYVQVSIHESFGCSLAEAMLCECIPVVSRRAAIPEVVGETGFYVDKIEPKEVANKIKKALMMPDNYAEKARRRIADKFSLEKREKEISNYLNILSNET